MQLVSATPDNRELSLFPEQAMNDEQLDEDCVSTTATTDSSTSTSIFLSLPDEILIRLLSYLQIWDVGRLQCTCRMFRELGEDKYLRTVVDFREFKVSSDYYLLHVLERTVNLRRLNLGGCSRLTSSSLDYIGASCPMLETLSLSGMNKLSDEMMSRIFISINSETLTQLDLSYCGNISDFCLDSIITSLKFKSLTTLKLNQCVRIKGDTCTDIARCCPNLIRLEMDGLLPNQNS